jgi:Predicted periplasmic solute-binding protein
MFKVGKVSYLNTIPLFYRFEDPMIELVEGEPSYLVSLLRDEKIQAGIVSSVEYLFNRSQYRVASGLCIASKQRVCSVLLLSRRPLLEIKSVYLTPASLTSKILCKHLLEDVYKLKPEYVESRESADALMLIGDDALYEKKLGKFEYVYDLAEEWHKVYSLPFVFALFLVRKDADPSLDRLIEELALRSIKAFYEDFAQGRLEVEGFSRDEVKDYFYHCIDYFLDEEKERSLELFGSLAYNHR